MFKEALRPAWAEINLNNFDYNVKRIIEKANGREVYGVIKADAYGHGAVECSKVLRNNGIKTFAVATLSEAIELRKSGAKEEIICLGLTPNMYVETLVEYDLTGVICSYSNAKAIDEAARKFNKTLSVFIAVDTGMGRIGYLPYDKEYIVNEIQKISKLNNIHVKGLFSHMATADAEDKSYSHEQEAKFNDIYEALTKSGLNIPMKTLANSASIMELPTVLFDAVRPGIIQYGCYPSEEVDKNNISLKPVMSIKAIILQLKDVPANFSVGYGRKYISDKPSQIATLGLGYADGYPRPYSPNAKVIVNGVICPIAGNICMDQCMVDVSDVPNVKEGDEVIVMGSDGVNSITATDIAIATGTINYEICCAFGQRLPKVYLD